jgi:mannose-6-phosphate isomerase-like protein (cupin superfamily)
MDAGQFERQAQVDGFAAPQVLDIGPNVKRELHTHDATCFLLVQDGRLTMLTEDGVEEFGPGETCLMPAGKLHAECTGPAGARGLIARK